MHSMTLKCACGRSETFTASKRYEVIIKLDASLWHSEPTADGWGHVSTCPDCHGTTVTHAEAAAAVLA